MVHWSVGRFVGWSVSWLVGQSVSWLVGWLVTQLAGRPHRRAAAALPAALLPPLTPRCCEAGRRRQAGRCCHTCSWDKYFLRFFFFGRLYKVKCASDFSVTVVQIFRCLLSPIKKKVINTTLCTTWVRTTTLKIPQFFRRGIRVPLY